MTSRTSEDISSIFHITEHETPCFHIREDIVRTSVEDGVNWKMSVRQYTPMDNLEPREGDITILGAPCLGFPKELYEPLWIELYTVLQKRGLRIKSIWIADPAQLGHSALANKSLKHEYAHPSNHARDLFVMINTFSKQFTSPILGIGHSIGATHLTQISIIHPTLFTSLILMDPILVSNPGDGNAFALPAFTLKRPQTMPTRGLARMGFSKAFKRNNDDGEGEVEMVVGRYQELSSYIRPPHMQGRDASTLPGDGEIEWCRQPVRAHAFMKMIAPPTLIVAGGNSVTSRQEVRDDWEKNYGINDDFRNPGQKRKFKIDVVGNGSHFFPFDDPNDVADRLGGWIEGVVGEKSVFKKEWESVKDWRALSEEEKEKYVNGWMAEQKVKLYSHKNSKL